MYRTTMCVIAAIGAIAICVTADAGVSANNARAIAFISQRNGGVPHIFVRNADGTVRQLTNNATPDSGPIAWSKDGTRLAFSRAGNIYRINADGTNQRQLTTSGVDFMPDWSPDGTKIVFLYVSSAEPPQITYLHTVNSTDGTDETELLGNGRSFFASPHYSPNGNTLLFESNLNTPGTFQIYTCSVSRCSTTVTQLTYLYPGAVADPAWSFDGTKIAVSMANARTGANVNVGIMNADGSHLTQLTNFIEPLEAQDPSISPDGNYIAFELDNCTGVPNCYGGSNDAAPAAVYTMNVDGSNEASTGQACSDIGCSARWQ
jgi:Tol biopolymer transport system component